MRQQIIEGLEGQEYRNFVNSIRSEQTKIQYIYALSGYMKFLNISSPSDLMFSGDIKQIQSHLIDYMVNLKNSVAYSTRNVRCSAVFTFYLMNDIILNKKRLYRYLGEPKKVHRDRAYTTEEIQRLLAGSDNRVCSIVLLLASSGCRLGALTSLKLRDLNPIDNYHLYRLTIYENTKEEYYTFTTPECRKAIDTYLEYRQRCGERLTADSPLFREQFDSTDQFMISKPKPLQLGGIATLIDNTLIRAGLRVIEHQTETTKIMGRVRKEVSRFNGFRKFVNTNMVRAKVNPVVKEMLLGHTTGLDDNYYRPSKEEVLAEYLKAIDLLTINEENRLRKKVVELTVKADRFDSIEEKVKLLEKKLGFE
jgi:integrase